MGQLRVQEYLDDVSELDIPSTQTEWYNVDVASLLTGSKVLGHEVDQCTGDSLLFLEKSVMLCSPSAGKMQHFPKHLLHCFVDDNRCECSEHDGVLFRAELFSISPTEEQLCWERCCRSEMEIPDVQSRVARCLSWLNTRITSQRNLERGAVGRRTNEWRCQRPLGPHDTRFSWQPHS